MCTHKRNDGRSERGMHRSMSGYAPDSGFSRDSWGNDLELPEPAPPVPPEIRGLNLAPPPDQQSIKIGG